MNIETEKAEMTLAVDGPGLRVYVEWNERNIGIVLRAIEYLKAEIKALDLKQFQDSAKGQQKP